MIVKFLAVILMCTGSECKWIEGSLHNEKWQCLYEIAEMRPKYYENKTMKFVDCKRITTYKHG